MNSTEWVSTLTPLLESIQERQSALQSRLDDGSYKGPKQIEALESEIRAVSDKGEPLANALKLAESNWVVKKEAQRQPRKIGCITNFDISPNHSLTVWVSWLNFSVDGEQHSIPLPEQPSTLITATPTLILQGLENLINQALIAQDEMSVEMEGISERAKKTEAKERREHLSQMILVTKSAKFQYIALADKICRDASTQLSVEIDKVSSAEIKLGQFSRAKFVYDKDKVAVSNSLPIDFSIPSGLFAKRKEKDQIVEIKGQSEEPGKVQTSKGLMDIKELIILPGYEPPIEPYPYPWEFEVGIATIYGEQAIQVKVDSDISATCRGLISMTGFRSMHPPLREDISTPEKAKLVYQKVAQQMYEELPFDTNGEPLLDGDTVIVMRGAHKGHVGSLRGNFYEGKLQFKDKEQLGSFAPGRLKLVKRHKTEYPMINTASSASTEASSDDGKLPEKVKRYNQYRAKHPENTIVAVLVGDFYETYYEDSVRLSQATEILRTTLPNIDGSARIPVSGLPVHAKERYRAMVEKAGLFLWLEGQEEEPNASTEATALTNTAATGLDKEDFEYPSIEVQEEARAIRDSVCKRTRASILSDYENGAELCRLRDEVLPPKKYGKWLKSKEWPYAVRTSNDFLFVYEGVLSHQLTLDQLNSVVCYPTDLRVLFAPRNHEAATEVVAMIKKGETVTSAIIKAVIDKYTPKDEYAVFQTGCYSCKNYELRKNWRFCGLHDARLHKLEEAEDLNAELGCPQREAIQVIDVVAQGEEQDGDNDSKATEMLEGTDEAEELEELEEENQEEANVAHVKLKLPSFLKAKIQELAEGEGEELEEYAVRLLSQSLQSNIKLEKMQAEVNNLKRTNADLVSSGVN
jgi:hypothetical protein